MVLTETLSSGESFFQYEPLTVRLKNLIHDYPEGIGILKELIQNADDAGATQVSVTFDWRNHSCQSLPDPRMSTLMGPAMLVYNDAIFSDDDFRNIQRLGEGGKKETLWKTGRFGVGFNSVYHVTDHPSFISRDRIVFFDPHASAIPHVTQDRPGWSWRLEEWSSKFDFMKVYEPGGFQGGSTSFDGTLFRLPLRTLELAQVSEIRKQPFSREDNVVPILRGLAEQGEELLLFLKSIIEIEISEILPDGTHLEIISVKTQNADEVLAERKKFLEFLRIQPNELLKLCEEQSEDFSSSSYLHTIETTTESQVTESTWRVVSLIRSDGSGEISQAIKTLLEQREKAVPWAGVAARIEIQSTEKEEKAFKGRAYCFLPLPQETNLPVHVNGFFDLDSSRRSVTSDGLTGRDKIRVEWNRLLVRHVIVYAYAKLLEELVSDIGQEDPSRFYRFWPVYGLQGKLFEELPHYLIPLLDDKQVICSSVEGKWIAPRNVYTLRKVWQKLSTPLSKDGIPFPEPVLPPAIERAFDQADLTLTEFQPRNLVQHLHMDCALGEPLDNAPKPSLQKREWIVDMLRYVLSDKQTDICGLPLAILADGKLQVFDHNPSGFIYTGELSVRQIFANYPQWFLDWDVEKQVPELKGRNGVEQLVAKNVVRHLRDVMESDCLEQGIWDPDGQKLPNVVWLATVYEYLSTLNPSEFEEETLRKNLYELPLVPGDDGKLHAKSSNTPLWPRPELLTRTLKALKHFQIPLIETKEPLKKSIAEFLKKHPPGQNSWIWSVTAAKVIDSLEATGVEVKFQEEAYVSLIDFLSKSSISDIQLKKLKKLKIFLTNTGDLTSLASERVYISGFPKPPRVAGRLKILRLGVQEDGQEWKRLFESMGITSLDYATFIYDCLLKDYDDFSDVEQLESLEWLRRNLDTVLTELESQGKDSQTLKQAVSSFPLIRCEDGRILPTSMIYAPQSKMVCEVLGVGAPRPDMDKTYNKNQERWLDFFRTLGMLTKPSASDLWHHIDSLTRTAKTKGVEAVRTPLMKVFSHIEGYWEELKDAVVQRPNQRDQFLRDLLKNKPWIPTEADEAELRRYPGSLKPLNRLCCPNQVALVRDIRDVNLIASQRPLFKVKRLPNTDFQNALGFVGKPRWQDVANHWEVLINLLKKDSTDSVESKAIGKALGSVYNYMTDTFCKENQASSIILKRPMLIRRFQDRECLWHDGKLWKPQNTFQGQADCFGEYRATIPTSNLSDFFAMLGQKEKPEKEDYVRFIDELYQLFDCDPLPEKEVDDILQVLYELARSEESMDGTTCQILTEDNILRAADRVLIPNAPWRVEHVRHYSESDIKLLHPQVSHELARAVGCRSLLKDVSEKPKGHVQRLEDKNVKALCDQWQMVLKSSEFREGLERLIRDEYEVDDLEFGWLGKARVEVAQTLITDLYLDSDLIAVDVSCDHYYDAEYGTFYLRFDEDILSEYLASCLNAHLKRQDVMLRNLAPLVRILEVDDVSRIETLLNKFRVKPLRKENWEFEKLKVSEIFKACSENDLIDAEDSQQLETEFVGEHSLESISSEKGHQSSLQEQISKQPEDLVSQPVSQVELEQSGASDEVKGIPHNHSTSTTNHVPSREEPLTPRRRSILDSSLERTSKVEEDSAQDVAMDNDFDIPEGYDLVQPGMSGAEQVESTHELPRTTDHKVGVNKERQPGETSRSTLLQSRFRTYDNGRIRFKVVRYKKKSKSQSPQSRFRTYVRSADILESDATHEIRTPKITEQEKINRAGMERVLAYERAQGRIPVEMAHNHPGYDVESRDSTGQIIRYIEVKSVWEAWGARGVKVSRTQFDKGQELQDRFWLYVVEYAGDNHKATLFRIKNPSGLVDEMFYDSGWKQIAESDDQSTEVTL